MGNQYEVLLKKQTVKRSLFFSVVDKAGFFKVLGVIGFLLLSFFSGYALYFNKLLENMQQKLPEEPVWSQYSSAIILSLLLGVFTLFLVVALLGAAALLLQIFIHLMFVEVPCRMHRKYLPLTQDEIKALDMNTKEFAGFCEYLCSRKICASCKTTQYASLMTNDLSDLMKLYCDTYNLRKCEGHCFDFEQISQHFSSEFRDHVHTNAPWLL